MNKHQNDPTTSQKVNLIKLSADVHKRDFKVCRQLGEQNIQPAQLFAPEEAFEWAVKQLELAERVVFCYEAGFWGFSLARRLHAKGIEAVVMCPQQLDERCKRVNTDRRDAHRSAGRLDRFLAGNDEALVAVRIPSEKEEDEPALSRQREQVLKVRKQLEAEGRSLVSFKGLSCPSGWWRGQPAHWQRTVQKHAWPTPVLERLEVYRRLILAAQSEIDALRLQLEEAAKENLPPSMPNCRMGLVD